MVKLNKNIIRLGYNDETTDVTTARWPIKMTSVIVRCCSFVLSLKRNVCKAVTDSEPEVHD